MAIFVSPVLTYFVGMGLGATCTSEHWAIGSKFVLGPLGALFISLLMFGLGGMLLTWMIGDQYWGTVIPTALCWGWIGVWGVGLTRSREW